jgi:twitching motility two-component system response regulator PilH
MKKILLVEDDPSTSTLLSQILQAKGFAVINAATGSEGYEKALSEQPDLILSDIMMPEMNGFQLTEKIKNTRATKSIPIILISALKEEQKESYAEDKEIIEPDAYILKPVQIPKLLEKINEYIT